jgi:phosphate starvation-inducible PhoH-like protein
VGHTPGWSDAFLTHEILLNNHDEAIKLFGRNGELRKRIQTELNVRVVDRGAKVVVIGSDKDSSFTLDLLGEMLSAVRNGYSPTAEDITYAIADARDRNANDAAGLADTLTEKPAVLRRDIRIQPRTHGQSRYLRAIEASAMTLVIGPAGTGKTYLAMAAAVSAMLNGDVSRIILTRPAVEAGENLGFLPGDLQQKVNPYLRPLYDALYSMVDIKRAEQFISREQIEVAPLAYMRGRTLNHAFAILDEAQNTTSEQMKMFLTRLGEGSRAVITGDVTQIDLPRGVRSGLVEAASILRDIPDIGIVHLNKNDVVRHPLVQRIVEAYDAHEAEKPRHDNRAPRPPMDDSPCT